MLGTNQSCKFNIVSLAIANPRLILTLDSEFHKRVTALLSVRPRSPEQAPSTAPQPIFLCLSPRTPNLPIGLPLCLISRAKRGLLSPSFYAVYEARSEPTRPSFSSALVSVLPPCSKRKRSTRRAPGNASQFRDRHMHRRRTSSPSRRLETPPGRGHADALP